MVVVGLILLFIGWLAGISILFWIGVALAAIGVILWAAGSMDRPIGPRRHYW